jgi:integrase
MRVEEGQTFRAVCEEFLATFYPNDVGKGPSIRSRLVRYVYPTQGDRQYKDVTSEDLLKCLNGILATNATAAAHACRKNLKRIGKWACAMKYAQSNQAEFLDGLMKPHKEKKFPGLTNPIEVGQLLRAIDGYRGTQPETLYLLKLMPYLFQRPSELRKAKWSQFNLAAGEWLLPLGVMKSRRNHIVPLPTQAIALLEELKQYSGSGEYLFPGAINKEPLSDNTVNAALRAMGYDTKTQHTGHGFRTTASTLLSKLGYAREVREAALAHKIPGTEGHYNEWEFMDVRRPMMQAYADYLDQLRATLPDGDQRLPSITAAMKSSMSDSSQREATSLGLNGLGNPGGSRSIMR